MSDKYHELKSIMFAKKVSQEKLANAIGITPQSLNNKLNARKDFYLREVQAIVDQLEIDDPTKDRIFFGQ